MPAYYSEWDPFAAQWLRELIKAGHIADGVVDDRSILDVSPGDLRGFTQCHFFAGIGVWSYALRRSGWADDRPAWTGSCPCQPLSVAGLGKGHADERHLWPAFHRLIAECRPPVVLGEQVAGKDGREWFSAVRADLEADGYACGGADLCAAGVGAPHIRQRLYWLAHAGGIGWERGRAGVESGRPAFPATERPRHAGGLADAGGATGERNTGAVPPAQARLDGEGIAVDGRDPVGHRDGGPDGGLADAAGLGGERRPGQDTGSQPAPEGQGREYRHGHDAVSAGPDGGLEHTAGNGRLERRPEPGERGAAGGRVTGGLADAALDGGPQVSAGADAIDRQRQALGWRPEQPAGAGADGGDRDGRHSAGSGEGRPAGTVAGMARPSADHGFWDAADWLYCRDGKWRPVEPGTFPLATGSPARVGRLRGYGNAINAEVAQTFIESVMDLA